VSPACTLVTLAVTVGFAILPVGAEAMT